MMRYKLIGFSMILLCLAMTACASKESAQYLPAPQAKDEAAEKETALYIGMGDDFKVYHAAVDGEMTPDKLIAAIADLTGWNLRLSQPVTDGKGGMAVVFSEDSGLFTGPPDPQKDEFRVYDAAQFVYTILDSIQRTLQENYVDTSRQKLSALPIWYAVQGDNPLVIEKVGLSLPIDEPYPGSRALIQKTADLSEGVAPAEDLESRALEALIPCLADYAGKNVVYIRSGDEMISGVPCLVFQVAEDAGDHVTTLGFYAVSEELDRVYEMDLLSGDYREIG